MFMESPFLHFPNLERDVNAQPLPVVKETYTESPFLNVNKLYGKPQGVDKKAEAYVTIVNELHDDEFNEQLEDLLNEMKDLRERYAHNGYMNNELQTRQLTQNYYMPMVREMNGYLDKMVQNAYEADNQEREFTDLEAMFDDYEFDMTDLSVVQEQWLGGLKKAFKKVASVAKKVGKGAIAAGKFVAKAALGPILNRVSGIFKKFLAGVLKDGINLLPGKYRTIAQSLAGKLLPASMRPQPAPVAPAAPEQDSTKDLAEDIQDGVNAAAAQVLTADNEMEWQLMEAELDNALEEMPEDTNERLSAARQRFIQQLNELEDGDNPAPAVEQFAPIVTTALKFALPLIGRERVKGWLTSLISKLIGPFVGKDNSQMLSRLMVDKGFTMLNLETADGNAGTTAIAEVVENTIRQVPEFPSYVLQDRQLFERYIVQAFERSAAAYLPDVLPEKAYDAQPELRESNERSVVWKNETPSAEEDTDAGHKVLNEVIETEINPFIANEIKTFGGIPLSVFLRDKLGITVTSTIPVKVHLFESASRNDLFQIAKKAKRTRGLGNGSRSAWMQLHPLTSVAAGLLMREPGLGCRKSKENCLGKRKSAQGHRYYYLEIDGARPQYFQPAKGKQVLRKHTFLKARLNFVSNEIALQLYLSESDAQAVAACLRKKNQSEAAQIMLMMAFKEGIKNIFSYGKSDYLKIIHQHVIPGNHSGMAIDKVPPVITRSFTNALVNWTGKAMISFLRDNGDTLIQAAEDNADGLSLRITFPQPPDMDVLKDILAGNYAGVKEDLFNDHPKENSIHASAGYQQD